MSDKWVDLFLCVVSFPFLSCSLFWCILIPSFVNKKNILVAGAPCAPPTLITEREPCPDSEPAPVACEPSRDYHVMSSAPLSHGESWNIHAPIPSRQSSCSVPGLGGLVCTNFSYFACRKLRQCVHPDLVCDGHPQCPEGEDEDLSTCPDEFSKQKIIQPQAQFRCKSHENMDIFATPHNNNIVNTSECWNGSNQQKTVD